MSHMSYISNVAVVALFVATALLWIGGASLSKLELLAEHE